MEKVWGAVADLAGARWVVALGLAESGKRMAVVAKGAAVVAEEKGMEEAEEEAVEAVERASAAAEAASASAGKGYAEAARAVQGLQVVRGGRVEALVGERDVGLVAGPEARGAALGLASAAGVASVGWVAMGWVAMGWVVMG